MSRSGIAYSRWEGKGPRVLLLHAIGLDRRTWRPVLPWLEEADVVAVDLPGHGASDPPPPDESHPGGFAVRVRVLLDELGWDEVRVAGNSLGGGTALAMALQEPERVSRLALLNTVCYPEYLPLLGRITTVLGRAPLIAAILEHSPTLLVRLGLETARVRRGTVSDDLSRACRDYLRDPKGREAFFTVLEGLYGPALGALAARYGEIRCPTLVVHGRQDPLIPFRAARRLAETLPAGTLVPVPACGHFPQEEVPGVIGPLLRDFLLPNQPVLPEPLPGETRSFPWVSKNGMRRD